MEGEQFSLSWNEFHKNLSSGFNALLEDSSLVDVSLAVEGRKIQAHKVVLSVCSDYFKELFNGNPCQHPIVFLKDVNYVVMQNILQFMYQGEVNVSQADLADFLKTAEDLKVKGLTGSSKEKSKSNSSQEIKNNDIAAPQGMNRSGRLRRTQSPAPLPTPQVQHRKSAPASNLPGTKRAKLSMGPASVTSQPLIKKQCIEASDHSAEAAESRNVEHVDIPDTNTMLTNLKSEPIDYDLGDDTLDESMPLNEADMAGDSFEGNDEEPKPGSSVDFLQQGDDKDNINQAVITSGNKRKFKRKAISLQEKLKILDRLERGEKILRVSKEYNLNEATIRTIKRNEKSIRDRVSIGSLESITRVARVRNNMVARMENFLIKWIEECNGKNLPLNHQRIKQKALTIVEHLKTLGVDEGEDKFIASNGWFYRFKERFNLHNITTQGERATVDVESAKKCSEKL